MATDMFCRVYRTTSISTPAQLDTRTPQRHPDFFPATTCFRLTIFFFFFLSFFFRGEVSPLFCAMLSFSKTIIKCCRRKINAICMCVWRSVWITKMLSQKNQPCGGLDTRNVPEAYSCDPRNDMTNLQKCSPLQRGK